MLLLVKYRRVYELTSGAITKSVFNTLERIWRSFPYSIGFLASITRNKEKKSPRPLGSQERMKESTLSGDGELSTRIFTVEVEASTWRASFEASASSWKIEIQKCQGYKWSKDLKWAGTTVRLESHLLRVELLEKEVKGRYVRDTLSPKTIGQKSME